MCTSLFSGQGHGAGGPHPNQGADMRGYNGPHFTERIIPVTESGCWLWEGYLDKWGYGRVRVNGKRVSAHRAFYEHYIGNIPDGLELDHLCKVRCCVNISHLEPVTPMENNRRGDGICSINARKTHCVNGHLLVGENIKKVKEDERKRICLVCARDRARIKYSNNR